MKSIYIVDLESMESRYTVEWKWHLPELLKEHLYSTNNDEYYVEVIEGDNNIPEATTPGAFINFGGTNIYKSSQLIKIAKLFCEGKIVPGSKFLYTDAWNPTILQVKYMSELLGIPVELHGIFHAGSYDPQDFLGRLIGDKPWVRYTERALMYSLDYSWFATKFHKDMFTNVFNPYPKHLMIGGLPFEYLKEIIKPAPKRDLILFPHRLAPEKQLPVFKALAERMPQFEWVVCQEKNLTKEEYHKLLGEAKIVFSANLQETLGISCYEGALANAIPLVPNRLSYTEMYTDTFKFKSDSLDDMEAKILDVMNYYPDYVEELPKLIDKLQEFFCADKMLAKLTS